eukprot:jgi/Orpsp1_1/1191567/evm.model.d7180000087050.1
MSNKDNTYIELEEISSTHNDTEEIEDITNYEEHLLLPGNQSSENYNRTSDELSLTVKIPSIHSDDEDIHETSSLSDFTPVLNSHHEPLLDKSNNKDSLDIQISSPIQQIPKTKITFKSLFSLDYELTAEALPSLIISVIGLAVSGWLLDIVMGWKVYESIPELIVLIPILLNLKGNLEMNLASRLSTESNLGHLDTYNMGKDIIIGNMVVLQAQAFIVGSVSGLFAWFMGGISDGAFVGVDKTIVLVISSIFSASICSFILGTMVSVIIVYSKKLKINPDNVATPLA